MTTCSNCTESRPVSPGFEWCDECRFSDPDLCPWCDGFQGEHTPDCNERRNSAAQTAAPANAQGT